MKKNMNKEKDSRIYLVVAVVEKNYVEKQDKLGYDGNFRILKAVDKSDVFLGLSTGRNFFNSISQKQRDRLLKKVI